MKPLFIPLKSEYFEAFASGKKNSEYRPYGPRWNERTCLIGRPVTLSKGYGKKHRLSGVIAQYFVYFRSSHLPDYERCYGPSRLPVAVIVIRLDGAL